ncbi:Ufm1-specific protease 2 [Salpingoeca rosetta]|uniref:Ufm1-specific protease 2 n=1 Tax=Salpingoeca rosetta (strain ATCC 50818 / BSB-021) TaxID=946362 RepID=F2UG52_SALR5|nr:Ufm1-specific protease 2 [Salpingoeca rosetta]EGD75480.1 Ufm1-specific protease 2 [Salpingoeca rosetta]|eukprot:XP_004991937.1 Ufm1-specific protease 2 [Salpingoeca rosetta]
MTDSRRKRSVGVLSTVPEMARRGKQGLLLVDDGKQGVSQIVGCISVNEPGSSKDVRLAVTRAQAFFPPYLHVGGVFAASLDKAQELSRHLKPATRRFLLVVETSTSVDIFDTTTPSANDTAPAKITSVHWQEPAPALHQLHASESAFFVRVSTTFTSIHQGGAEFVSDIRSQMDAFKSRISGDDVLVFVPRLQQLTSWSQRSDTCDRISTEEVAVRAALSDFADVLLPGGKSAKAKGKSKAPSTKKQRVPGVIEAHVSFAHAHARDATSTPAAAPVLAFQKGKVSTVVVDVSVLARAAPTDCITTLREQTITSVCAKLDVIADLLITHSDARRVVCRHFSPPPLSSPVWIPLATDEDTNTDDDDASLDRATEPQRRALLSLLCLHENRPYLRSTNACDVMGELPKDPAGRPRDPHLSIRYSPEGKLYMVDGHYDYYHYMQDKFDDDQWGCAYRSCQTICSWYRLQGYSARPIPSHHDIQETLVAVGDKPASFVGSRTWIGSQEIFLFVNKWFEADFEAESRFIFNVTGEDLPTKARELALHFERTGSPVMIGGSNLAHTIIGIDWQEQLGRVRWLVLDPHYTGKDDLGVIHKQGWCAWKDSSFWNKRATYNLLLPGRPALV